MEYKKALPIENLSDFVECFWTVSNIGGEEKSVTVLPDGYFDILFSSTDNKPFKISLVGLSTMPVEYFIPTGAVTYAISFRLPAAEYVLKHSIAPLINKRIPFNSDLWKLRHADIHSFECFVSKANEIMSSIPVKALDIRKIKLFRMIYASHGAIAIQKVSDSIGWSSRQINRYFDKTFGMPLKVYCNILRYRASFNQLKEGKSSGSNAFSDQAHFIREVKKFSGVTPRQLSKNKNDRFIQLSTLSEK
jgi:AraC-like DNA-binding protein